MTYPILYSFRRCPYAMRARLAIQASNVQVVLREVVLKDKPQAMLDVSAKATVPVLVLPDGRVLDESLDIMLWALQQNDPSGLLQSQDAAEVQQHPGRPVRRDGAGARGAGVPAQTGAADDGEAVLLLGAAHA